jgi:hypothetical protein
MSRMQAAPDFTSFADLSRHYAGVRDRLGWRRQMTALRPPLLLSHEPLDDVDDEPRELIEVTTVQDIIPKQRLALPEYVKPLSREAEAVAIRRAIHGIMSRIAAQPYRHRVSIIKAAVSTAFKINPKVLVHSSRAHGALRPRQIAIALTRRLTVYSLHETGLFFGGRDHTTVLHSAKRMKSTIDEIMTEMYDGMSCSISPSSSSERIA